MESVSKTETGGVRKRKHEIGSNERKPSISKCLNSTPSSGNVKRSKNDKELEIPEMGVNDTVTSTNSCERGQDEDEDVGTMQETSCPTNANGQPYNFEFPFDYPDTSHEDMYKFLMEKLPTVEGFKSESWGESVEIRSTHFYKEQESESKEVLERKFQEFLSGAEDDNNDSKLIAENENCSSDQNEKCLVSVVPIDSELRSSDKVVNEFDTSLECFKLQEEESEEAQFKIMDNEQEQGNRIEPSTSTCFDGNFVTDISTLPEEAITSDFVLDYVLREAEPVISKVDRVTPKTDFEGDSIDYNGNNNEMTGTDTEKQEESFMGPASEFQAAGAEFEEEEKETQEETFMGPVSEFQAAGAEFEVEEKQVEICMEPAPEFKATDAEFGDEETFKEKQTVEDHTTQEESSEKDELRRLPEANSDGKLDNTLQSHSISTEILPPSKSHINHNSLTLPECLVYIFKLPDDKSLWPVAGKSDKGSVSDSIATREKSSVTEKENTERKEIKERLKKKLQRAFERWKQDKAKSQSNGELLVANPNEKMPSSSNSQQIIVTNVKQQNGDIDVDHVMPAPSTSTSRTTEGQILSLYKDQESQVATEPENSSHPPEDIVTEESEDNLQITQDCQSNEHAEQFDDDSEKNCSMVCTNLKTPEPTSNTEIQDRRKSLSKMSKKQLRDLMDREVQSDNPDLLTISIILDLTFKERKRQIDKEADTQSLFTKFSGLKLYPMVKEEFGRVSGNGNIKKMDALEKQIESNLLKALNLNEKKSFSGKHHLWHEATKRWKTWNDTPGSDESPDNNKKVQVLGMVALCVHLAENLVLSNLCRVLKEEEEISDEDCLTIITPTLVLKQSEIFDLNSREMWIYVEGVKYLQVPNFYEAVLSIYSIYYIYNLEYDKKLNTFFKYFDDICNNELNPSPKTTKTKKSKSKR